MAATDQLDRLLYVLAVASREDGATYTELSSALGVDHEVILKDLQEAIDAEFNHPAGSVEPFTIMLEQDRVTVYAAKEFCRPVRLSQREALALELGLRVLAADADVAKRARIMELASRLEKQIVTPDITLQPAPEIDVVLGDDSLRDVFVDAIEQKRVCIIEYVKPFSAPQARRIAPIRLIYGKGRWYLSAHDVDAGENRIFRVDRILSATVTEDQYEPAATPTSATLYSADGDAEVEARVRYSGQVGKWIAESGTAPLEQDGSVLVVHRVADVDWLVRHVLQYGGEAVVETPALRKIVAAKAAQIIRSAYLA